MTQEILKLAPVRESLQKQYFLRFQNTLVLHIRFTESFFKSKFSKFYFPKHLKSWLSQEGLQAPV